MAARDGSPFSCDTCGGADRGARNCGNRLGLSEGARAVTEYTAGVVGEHGEKGAGKVFRLGDIRLYECPLSYLTPDTAEMMRAVYLAEGSAALLNPGGWGAQPQWFVEACDIYRAERAGRITEKRGDGTRPDSAAGPF